ncbi:uncharacterized protein LOC125668209 [Ostrea edulis]|uniref:uncharacterized protein LOC125668209 n=1 Tax=Ostrea edulis TaxID=37623 RepID=UPI002095CD46|nr:uncharacterized protein LOC125668209 [Ostrea edulis]
MQLRIKFISSSTHTVPYSTADIVYGIENSQSDDVEGAQNSCVDVGGKESRISSSENTDSNVRHSSDRGGVRKSVSTEKVNLYKESEDNHRPHQLYPSPKHLHCRTNGVRSGIHRGEQTYNMRTNSFPSGRETEDLIAMGTIWSPNAQTSVKQLNSSTSSASSLTNNSITNVTGRNMHISTSQGTSNSTGLPQTNRGRYNIAGMKPILVQSSKISNMKDVEPRYIDPVIGAPASFQQRLMELSALEAETIRYERSKKVKKKFKQDRDS